MFLGVRFTALVRCYQLSTRCLATAPDKQLLSKLRKTTGFSFVNCRKALEKFNNNITEAEAWLRSEAQKEGWAKASKLQGRPMSQGLIGLTIQENCAAIVEVNCETDFVARNGKFNKFVTTITSAFLQHGSISNQNKIVADQKGLGSLQIDGRSVVDMTALEVGNIGENIAVRRGVFLRTQDAAQKLASYVHATGPPSSHHSKCLMGKYGALVLFQPSNPVEGFSPPSPDAGVVPVEELGRRLCQHVVGMNPATVGEYEAEEVEVVKDQDGQMSEGVVKNQEEGQVEGVAHEEGKPAVEVIESRLVHQEYMHDTSMSVGAMLQLHGATVVDFVRFECGAPDDAKELDSVAVEQATARGEKKRGESMNS